MVDKSKASAPVAEVPNNAKEKTRREIRGNLPYLPNPAALKNVLAKIVTASVPDKFSQDFLGTVLGYPGGSYKQVIPILKRIGMLTGDGKPTELYSRFRTDSGRPGAVYAALRSGYAELFKRNDHLYAATDQKLSDLIVEVTGLAKTDPVVGLIKATYKALSGYLPPNFSPTSATVAQPTEEPATQTSDVGSEPARDLGDPAKLNLSYNINIVLPDTKDIEVFNVIFRSLRENLLR